MPGPGRPAPSAGSGDPAARQGAPQGGRRRGRARPSRLAVEAARALALLQDADAGRRSRDGRSRPGPLTSRTRTVGEKMAFSDWQRTVPDARRARRGLGRALPRRPATSAVLGPHGREARARARRSRSRPPSGCPRTPRAPASPSRRRVRGGLRAVGCGRRVCRDRLLEAVPGAPQGARRGRSRGASRPEYDRRQWDGRTSSRGAPPRGSAALRGAAARGRGRVRAPARRTGAFETGVRRIGLEQELFLIDEHGRPVRRAMEVLDALGGPGAIYQTELALFNVEVALEPVRFEGDCLTRLERELRRHLAAVRKAAQKHGVDAVAIGILPTLGWEHLGLDWMTPNPRYRGAEPDHARAAGRRLPDPDPRDRHPPGHARQPDAGVVQHLVPAPPAGGPRRVRARSTTRCSSPPARRSPPPGNSPLLLGHRLWEETRIALFRQSVDARSDHHQARGSRPRVFFGDAWVEGSVLEIVRDDITHFRVDPADRRGRALARRT